MKNITNVKVLAAIIAVQMVLGASIPVAAGTYHSYGDGEGRSDSVNENDYSTDYWDRFEYNYNYSTGSYDYMGTPTTTDIEPNITDPNVRGNKDVSDIPPSYGVFSGEIDTAQSNPYFTKDDTSNAAITGVSSDSGVLSSTSLPLDYDYTDLVVVQTSASGVGDVFELPDQNVTVSAVVNTNVSTASTSNTSTSTALQTQVATYSSGSMGILTIPSLNVTASVYEGATTDSMKKGVGHFDFTSAWDGNVGFAGHNSGSAGYFENIKNLEIGDIITYETPYGTRTYAVTAKTIIKDTDFTTLGYSSVNQLTLITCNKGVSDERISVTATEI